MNGPSTFDPHEYPELFEVVDDRIFYKKALRTGQPKNYVWSDPEEKVRAWFYAELVDRFGYPPSRIDLEVEVYRREPEDFADIVVFRDDGFREPYLVVECKAREADLHEALRQAWGNANNLRAEYGVGVAGPRVLPFRAEDFDLSDPERYKVAIPERYGQPVRFRYRKGDPEWDLQPATLDELRSRFQKCHDVLWEGGRRNPAEAFDEMSKLMYCKLLDERHGTPDGEFYKFQIGSNETVGEVADRIYSIYNHARQIVPSVFRTGIQAAPELIFRVVEILQDISLHRTDLDAKGRAFETFLGTVFRGEMGQYFTPRPIVEFVVEVLQPTVRDRIMDPACGSGGFLLYSLERVQREAERLFKDVANQRDYWKDWALRALHGIEINDQISRIAMMGMILHEDGHTNIRCTDALQRFEDLAAVAPECRPGSFTLVMTNPPFGAIVRRATPRGTHPYLDTYELGGKNHKRSSQRTEILFLERCLDLLEPGGRMAIVLPEGVFNNPSLAYVRSFVEERAFLDAVVSLPEETFVSAGASVKASLLFLRKFTAKEARRVQQVREEVKAELWPRYEAEIRDVQRQYRLRILSCDREDLMDLAKKVLEEAEAKNRPLTSKSARELRKQLTKEDLKQRQRLQGEMRRRIEHLEARFLEEVQLEVRRRLDYHVFVANANHVGITATGQEDKNELPEIAKAYHEMRRRHPLRLGEAATGSVAS